MSENPVRRKYSRHIDIRRYFVRDLVAQQVLKLVPLRTNLMVAFQGLDRCIWSLEWGGKVDRGKEDCKQAAQANRLTLVLGQKGGSRVWQLGWCNYVELIDTIFTDVEGVD
jgi:hypothetical protein